MMLAIILIKAENTDVNQKNIRDRLIKLALNGILKSVLIS
jgi:hypothetical protein